MEYSQTQIITLIGFQKLMQYNCPLSRIPKPAVLPDCRFMSAVFMSENFFIVLFVERSTMLILMHRIQWQAMTKVPSRLCVIGL